LEWLSCSTRYSGVVRQFPAAVCGLHLSVRPLTDIFCIISYLQLPASSSVPSSNPAAPSEGHAHKYTVDGFCSGLMDMSYRTVKYSLGTASSGRAILRVGSESSSETDELALGWGFCEFVCVSPNLEKRSSCGRSGVRNS